MKQIVEREIQGNIATLTLNRPEVHNALNNDLIELLIDHLTYLNTASDVRVVVFNARGKSFCAGADISSMKNAAQATYEENLKDAERLSALMHTLYTFTKPTIAVVQGAVYGGGIGLLSCMDIVVASDAAVFAFSEVKLGIIPAIISPYVIARIGISAAQRYFLTAERFGVGEAFRIGLVHEVVTPAELEPVAQHMLRACLDAGPEAQARVKKLIQSVANKPIDEDMRRFTAQAIADCRDTTEAKEGLSAFLEKRLPNWRDKNL